MEIKSGNLGSSPDPLLPALWSWARHLPSLNLGFPTWKLKIVIPVMLPSQGSGEMPMTLGVRVLETLLSGARDSYWECGTLGISFPVCSCFSLWGDLICKTILRWETLRVWDQKVIFLKNESFLRENTVTSSISKNLSNLRNGLT